MNKKIQMLKILCGLLAMTSLSPSIPALHFTSKYVIAPALKQVVKIKNNPLIRAIRGLGKESLAALVGQKTASVIPSMVTSVPAAAVLPSAAHVYTTLAAQKESFMRLAHSAYGLTVQAAPKAAANNLGKNIMTPFKKVVAAGCATAATGMTYVGSHLAGTQTALSAASPTVFQSTFKTLSQHKVVASGLTVATVATAYCARYKINPATKIKKLFRSQVLA